MRSTRARIVVLVVLVLAFAAACAAGANAAAAHTAQSAGFWLGLWHGLITPVTFIISLFTDKVNIYEVHNNGNWYDFGYVLGLIVAFGGPARSACAARSGSRSASRSRSGSESGSRSGSGSRSPAGPG